MAIRDLIVRLSRKLSGLFRMNDIKKELQAIFEPFESREEVFPEYEIDRAMKEFTTSRDLPPDEIPMEVTAESSAFQFREDARSEETGWGTYYGPFSVMSDAAGQFWETPSLSKVTPEILAYWAKRTSIAQHPVLITRYADLVWDFSKQVLGNSADVQFAYSLIDSTLSMVAVGSYRHPNNIVTKLARALSVALSINDGDRIQAVVNHIINFEISYFEIANRRSWGFAYDLLLANPKIALSADQEAKVVEFMEAEIAAAADKLGEGFDPHAVEDLSIKLASYYRHNNKNDEKKRVMERYASSVSEVAGDAAGMLASNWLSKAHRTLRDFGMLGEAEKLEPQLREKANDTITEMQEISVEAEIPIEEIENYLNWLTEGPIEQCLKFIAAQFIPRQARLKEQVENIAANHPLLNLVAHTQLATDGRPVAVVGSAEEDLDGRIAMEMTQNMHIQAFVLRGALERLQEEGKLNSDIFIDLFKDSPVTMDQDFDLLKKGLDYYFEDDFITACHLLIPQCELFLRNLVAIQGGSIYRAGRYGGFDVKALGSILSDPLIKQSMGEDAQKYLRILFSDPRGWNLRNEVCHGLVRAEFLNSIVTDRIFHVLILLCLLQKNEPDGNKA